MLRPESPYPPKDSQEYKQHEGAAVFTHISNRLVEYVDAQPIEQLTGAEVTPAALRHGVSEANLALHSVSELLNRPWQKLNNDYATAAQLATIDPDTFERMGKGTNVGYGLTDLDFPGHFVPALAASIVDLFVDDGYIAAHQAQNMTLGNFADMIRAPWFGKITHQMARTKNGVYTNFGKRQDDYALCVLKDRLAKELSYTGVPFTSAVTHTSADAAHLSAVTTKAFRQSLRQGAQDALASESLGCPVARHTITLADELVASSPPIQQFIHSGQIQASGRTVSEGRTHFTQERSAIDITLEHIAKRLNAYEDAFGTPRLQTKTVVHTSWEHHKIAPQPVTFTS